MCGFVGTTNHQLVRLMINKQEHRGPDATEYYYDHKFAFAHCLLDISQERQIQPYITPKGNILLFNGEMYDTTIPNDTEWLGKALDKYGYKFLEHTDWHGSIAWYVPQKGKLVLVRDHFGAKPLWWRFNGGHFEFSTSLSSFFDKELDPKQFTKSFLKNTQLFGDQSMYKHIHKVEAGAWLEFDVNDNFKLFRRNLWDYFSIKSEKLHTDEFRYNIKEAVHKVAKNKNKTALFLSGGMDSTIVASLLRDSDIDIEVFTMGYNLAQKGHYWGHKEHAYESDMAVKTAEEWGYKVHKLQLDRDDRAHFGKMWLANTHYLWSDQNRQAPRYLLCKAAAEQGCKVVLTGDSGDELFTGYNHHSKRFDENECKQMVKFFSDQRWFPYKAFGEDNMSNSLFSDLLCTSEQNILATDQTAGMFGMESRIPLLTQTFAKYVLSIMGRVKFRQTKKYPKGTNKFLMREVMKDYLPDHVRLRNQKVGWSSPWDNNHPELSPKWRKQDLEFIKTVM
tara:strand:- start:42 stop:1556 length:1515 start_codon:yes stop_codon:yes gene_type:complete